MKNSSPKLSIIIATYNAATTLSKALNSVISLNYSDWECLIIDGGSKDNTLNIVYEFERKDSRIRHISEQDKGLYDAFNKGWKNACGEWVYYLGSDDNLTSDGMSQLMSQAEKTDEKTAIVSGGVIRIRQDGSERILMSKGFVGSHQSMVMRRSVLKKMNGFNFTEYKILADYDLFVKIKNYGYKVKNCDVVVACFHAGGTSERLGSILKVFNEKYKILCQDKYCKSPLFSTFYDTFRTVAGSIYHRTKKIMSK